MVVRNAVQGNPQKGREGQQSLFNQRMPSASNAGATRVAFRTDRQPQARSTEAAVAVPQFHPSGGNVSRSAQTGGTFRKRNVVNKVMLEGRLGRDPDLKQTQGGRPFAKFQLATQESYKDASGEWQKRTQWHRVRAWGEIAEAVAKYLRKGSYVHIEGKLSSSEWIDKQNNKRTTTEVVATGLRFLDAAESTVSVQLSKPPGQFQQDARATGSAAASAPLTETPASPA